MKFKSKYIIIFLTLLFCTNIYAQTNKILFKVDNEIITSLDLLEEIRLLKIINAELNNLEADRIYEIAKNSLFRQKIKKIELSKKLKNFNIEDEILEKLLIDYFRKLKINSINELENFLLSKNININQVKNRVKIDILWNEFIYAKYSKKIKINKLEIEKELKNKKLQDEFMLSELLFSVSKKENLNKKIIMIQDAIKSKGFSEAALLFSDSSSAEAGGKIGWIKNASLNKKIRNEIKTLSIGSVTKPIVVPGGFLILKLENKRTIEIELNFEKEIDLISQRKMLEQLNQFSNIYFNKLKKNVIINEL